MSFGGVYCPFFVCSSGFGGGVPDRISCDQTEECAWYERNAPGTFPPLVRAVALTGDGGLANLFLKTLLAKTMCIGGAFRR